MHVLVLPSSYPHPTSPSSGIFFKEQADSLHQLGLKVGVVAPIRRSLRTYFQAAMPAYAQMVSEVPTIVREYFAIPKFSKFNDFQHVSIGLRLYDDYVRVHGTPDLLHAHSALHGGVLAREISARFGIPYVVTEHSSAFGRGIVTAEEISIAKRVFSEAICLISVSPSLASDVEKRIPTTLGRWICIPNCVDTDFFSPLGPPQGGLGKFTFLTIADLNKNKNVDLLVRAFARMANRGSLHLNIGGDGAELLDLQREVLRLGIGGSVKFLGPLSRRDVLTALNNCDVFVLPSRYETFGVVLIEALAVGKPVIASACGGPDTIVERHNGVLFPVNDVDSLTRAMEKIIDQYTLYSAEDIRVACMTRFGSRAVAAQIAEVYGKLRVLI